jgi:hypothetical protein
VLGTSLSRVHRAPALDASNPMTGPGRAFSGGLVRGEDPRQHLRFLSSFPWAGERWLMHRGHFDGVVGFIGL